MDINSVYKSLNEERDVLYLQTVERDRLFRNSSGKVKPYSGSSIETIEAPEENEEFYTPVDQLEDDSSGAVYFSTSRGVEGDYETSGGDSYMFHQMKQLTRPNRDGFVVEEFGLEVTEIDVIALSREFYKDSLDPDYFCTFINTSGSTPTSAPSSFSQSGDVLGLYAGEENRQSKLGKKRFLYPTTSSSTLYDPSTDELTMVGQSDLNKSKPYGEVYLEAGFIILFTNVIEDEHSAITTTTTFHFLAGVVGRSEIQLNSELYYIRMYNQEFNYTTNPTFYEDVDDNIIKSQFRDNPTTYITTVGLYNDDGGLIAVGRLSRPIEKNFEKEAIIHAQLSL